MTDISVNEDARLAKLVAGIELPDGMEFTIVSGEGQHWASWKYAYNCDEQYGEVVEISEPGPLSEQNVRDTVEQCIDNMNRTLEALDARTPEELAFIASIKRFREDVAKMHRLQVIDAKQADEAQASAVKLHIMINEAVHARLKANERAESAA